MNKKIYNLPDHAWACVDPLWEKGYMLKGTVAVCTDSVVCCHTAKLEVLGLLIDAVDQTIGILWIKFPDTSSGTRNSLVTPDAVRCDCGCCWLGMSMSPNTHCYCFCACRLSCGREISSVPHHSVKLRHNDGRRRQEFGCSLLLLCTFFTYEYEYGTSILHTDYSIYRIDYCFTENIISAGTAGFTLVHTHK